MPWRNWIRTVEVEPSLYAADFSIIGEQIEVLLRAGCRVFHFDVGDGHFVEPITMGPIVLQSISPLIHRYEGAVDVHLMVENPTKYFESIAAAGGVATLHVAIWLNATPGSQEFRIGAHLISAVQTIRE